MIDSAFVNFGSRLRAARKMAGMSLGDLSGKIGGAVTRQAISKYEKGRMMPSPEVFERLNETLAIQANVGPTPKMYCQLASAAEPSLDLPSFPISKRKIREDKALCLTEPSSLPSRESRLPDEMIGLSSRRRFRVRRIADAAPAYSRTEPAIDQVRFREREKLPAKTAIALRLRVADYVKRCVEIESALGIQRSFENPLAGCAVRTAADVETAASDVRRAWDLGSGPVANLLGLLEGRIRCSAPRHRGFEGLWELRPSRSSRSTAISRTTGFTAVDELGHLLCGFPEREGAESLCHAFAGAFLLLREAAERALMPARRKISLWELKELKEGYGISLQAIVHRARSLGLITGRQFRKFRETIRAKGWLVTEPVEYRE
jgi:transcriptional regulator with XRE-family HTH domain